MSSFYPTWGNFGTCYLLMNHKGYIEWGKKKTWSKKLTMKSIGLGSIFRNLGRAMPDPEERFFSTSSSQ